RRAFVFERNAWRALPPMPAARAAGGAAIVADKLYVVGGVGPAGLARQMLVLDLATRRWSAQPGPLPREHLPVASAGGRLYARGERGADPAVRALALAAFVAVLAAGCGGDHSTAPVGDRIVVAALGDSITSGSPGYDPDKTQRKLLGFGGDEHSQWEYWARLK